MEHMFYVSNISFGRHPNPSGFGNRRVAKWANDLGLTQVGHIVALVCGAQEGLLARSKICWALKYILPNHTWVMMSIERNSEIQGRHLTS